MAHGDREKYWGRVIVTQRKSMQGKGDGGLSLLFAKGQRPLRSDIAKLAGIHLAATEGGFSLGDPGELSSGRVELVASGLSFDLSGLAPAPSCDLPEIAHRFGEADRSDLSKVEGIRLDVGEHLVGGQALLPVVRTMMGLAARLAGQAGVVAVAWHPARSLIGPGLFRRQIEGWLAGGAFPALGLASLALDDDGGLRSEGLAFFTGQELLVDGTVAGGKQGAARVAVRLMDAMVAGGPITAPVEIAGIDGSGLLATPAPDGRIVRVSASGTGV